MVRRGQGEERVSKCEASTLALHEMIAFKNVSSDKLARKRRERQKTMKASTQTKENGTQNFHREEDGIMTSELIKHPE